MNFQDIVSHILGFCLLVADFPALFKTQTTTPISQHLSNLDIPNYQLDATTSTAPAPTTTYTCPSPRDVSLAVPSMNTCNDATNRQNWCNATINTDYELPQFFPVTNVTRHYTLVITSGDTYCGDGYAAPVMLINGSYPGPLIEGNWGDWFEITVINNLSNCNGTSIHWHGLRQWNTVWEDGVGGVTQCPIPPALSGYTGLHGTPPPDYSNQQVYKWQATQYGASWYHSHFSLQYADGIAGPLVIHGPTSANYDVDLGPMLITDWYHQDAFSMFYIEEDLVVPQNVSNAPPSKLMNGMGKFTKPNGNGTLALPGCDSTDHRCVPQYAERYRIQNIKQGQTYRLRIINTSTQTHYTFWIEGHTFQVIATDFVPIEPWSTNVLNVAIGQRYDIIFQADADLSKGDSFWIKMRNCGSICISPDNPPCPPHTTCNYEDCNQGILSYSQNNEDPDKNSGPDPGNQQCLDIPMAEIHPIVTRTVSGIPGVLNLDTYQVSNDNDTSHNPPVISRWSLSDTGYSFKINWEDPALILMESQPNITTWQPRYVPIEIDNDNNTHNVWHAFVIEANFTSSTGLTPLHVSHPIHLHGHDYVVLYQSSDEFDPTQSYPLNLVNPLRRDVAMLPSGGFLILAFRVDNPGSWLMHCHIAWHASNGLALQFVESKLRLPEIMTTNPNYQNVFESITTQCDNWKWWYSESQCLFDGKPAKQDDSGI